MDYSNRLNSSPARLTEHEAMTNRREMDKITTGGGEEEGTDEPWKKERAKEKDARICSKSKHRKSEFIVWTNCKKTNVPKKKTLNIVIMFIGLLALYVPCTIICPVPWHTIVSISQQGHVSVLLPPVIISIRQWAVLVCSLCADWLPGRSVHGQMVKARGEL